MSLIQDVNANQLPDDAVYATETTDTNGYYLFDNLPSGDYWVRVDPANFQPSAILDALNSSTGATDDATTDRDDNGVDPADSATYLTDGVLSNRITLAQDTMPTLEGDLSNNTTNDGASSRGVNGETDNNSNLTVDFGFLPAAMSLGTRVG